MCVVGVHQISVVDTCPLRCRLVVVGTSRVDAVLKCGFGEADTGRHAGANEMLQLTLWTTRILGIVVASPTVSARWSLWVCAV